MARVLIVGGAGFVGSHLAAHCVREGHDVHVLVRPTTKLYRLHHLEGRIQTHVASLQDREALQRCLDNVKPQRIFHLAVSTRRKQERGFGDVFGSINDDLIGFLSLLAAAAETRPPPNIFVRTGSLAAYGRAPTPHVESLREVPQTVYAATLVAGCHYVEALQARLPFPVVTARLSLVYGPDQSEEFLIPSLIRRCLTGQPSIVHHPGERRDIIFIDDVVEALHRLSGRNLPGGAVINIASGNAPTMRETASTILAATDADSTLVTFGLAEKSDGVDLCPSPALARRLLGWRAKVPLDRGIGSTVAWYRTQRL